MAGLDETAHDRYWKGVAECAERRLHALFHGSRTSVSDVIGDDDGIDDRRDVEKVLAHVLLHGNSDDRARGALAAFELVQAWHELSEHKGGAQ